ncbi:hypothetical protein BXZ70DRAFT_951119 [Cristinia sonorae]|uniref:NACHT domain-containing protein n=1 Tax=Cristinia sonorae TaxID=1940300 RepID=A0A8K0XM75_9AGAR|nr:hypothetical protein BXZ70DRAFT_951119 [Cristinia sonorae]
MSSDERKYRFTVISATLNNIAPSTHRKPLKAILWINDSLCLETQRSPDLHWNESTTMVSQTTLKNASIKCDLSARSHSFFSSKKIKLGRAEISWSSLEAEMNRQQGDRIELDLSLTNNNSKVVGSLRLSVSSHPSGLSASPPVSPQEASSFIYSPLAPTGLTACQRLVNTLYNLKKSIRNMSKIHGVACVAWSIVDTVAKAPPFQSVMDDHRAVELLVALDTCYDFSEYVRQPDHRKTEQLASRIIEILRQTIEGVLFINECLNNPKHAKTELYPAFLKRANLLKRSEAEYWVASDVLTTYKAARGDFVTIADVPAIRSISVRGRSSTMSYLSSCLPETRSGILEDICAWLATSTGRICLVRGAAGSGKTAIALTIADLFRSQERLAAQIFLAKDTPSPSSPEYLIRHLAYHLTELYDRYACSVAAAIRANPDVYQESLAAQFNKLLVKPLSELRLESEGPLIIVIDGLDQCGTVESRKPLLSVLRDQIDLLPPVFRFLITTRNTAPDVAANIGSNPQKIVIRDLESDPNADRDIAALFDRALSAIRNSRRGEHLGLSWPGDQRSRDLVRRAERSFVWAWTVCKVLDMETVDPDAWISTVLERDALHGHAAIDDLYGQVAELLGGDQKEERVAEFQATFGVLLCAEEAMNLRVAGDLIARTSDVSLFKTSRRFEFAMTDTWSETLHLHPSFCDVFTNRDRCVDPCWYIDTPSHRYQQTVTILDYLPGEIQRILSTPHHFAALDDSDGAFFNYANCYWIDYVTKCPPDQTLRTKVLYFILYGFADWFAVADNDSRRRIGLLIGWFEQPCPRESPFSPLVTAAMLTVVHAYLELEKALPGDIQIRQIARNLARVRIDPCGVSESDMETLLEVERRFIFPRAVTEDSNQKVIRETPQRSTGLIATHDRDEKDFEEAETDEVVVSEEEKIFKKCVERVVDVQKQLEDAVAGLEDDAAGDEYQAWELAMSQASAMKLRQNVTGTFMRDVKRVGESTMQLSEEDILHMYQEAMRIGADDEI